MESHPRQNPAMQTSLGWRLRRDVRGRWIETVADGSNMVPYQLRCTYDGDRLAACTRATFAGEVAIAFRRDGSGRLVGVDDGDSHTAIAYGEHATTIAHGDGRTELRYDANGRLAAVRDGDDVTTFRYDAAGRLVTRDATHATTYRYDASGRFVRALFVADQPPGSGDLAVSYDAHGRIARVVSSDTDQISTTTYGYDCP
jgi:YD repeat-containing protein